MGLPIQDGASSTLATVVPGATGATGNAVLVNTGQTGSQAGYVRALQEQDSGSATGSPLLRPARVTIGRNTQVASESPVLYESFNYAAQNTADWKALTSTLTNTFGGGFTTLNGAGVTTAGSAILTSYRQVPIYADGGITFDVCFELSETPPSNFQCELGLFSQSGTAPYTPTDGVYFRVNSSGLFGIANFNGTETATATLVNASSLPVNSPVSFKIIMNANKVEFWQIGTQSTVAPVLLGVIFTPNATPFVSGALPVAFRQLHTAATPTVCQLKIGWVQSSINDFEANRPWMLASAGDGSVGYQGQAGGTMGSTSSYANSSTPAATTPSNTAAAVTGLGGQATVNATVAVNTDGIVFSYQNPAGSTAQQSRGLYIFGVTIDTTVLSALTGGPFILQWGLGFGHTSVALTATEGAGTKAPRRIALGFQNLPATAAAGTQPNVIKLTLQTPVYVNPGEFVCLFYKNIGTVGTAGTIAHTAVFDAMWE